MITLYTMERDYPYGTLRSTNGCKTKVVLEEKSIDYQVVGVRPGDVWKKVPEVLAKHPLGKVPWIDDGDLTVYDSTVINEYLNEKSDHAPCCQRMWRCVLKPVPLKIMRMKGCFRSFCQ